MGFFSKIGDWWNDNIYEPLVDGVTGVANDVSDWWNDSVVSPLEDLGSGISDWYENDVQGFFDTVGDGLTNTWNKYTGNAHLTPEYQHAEMREDTVNQRTAEDLQKAGLSKFSMSATPAGTSSAANGLTMLDAISKAQQIKANKLAYNEAKYNFGLSKRLGIRTGDKNALGSITSVLNALFGLNLNDVPEEGIIPYFINLIKGGVPTTGGSSDGSTTGAFLDAGGSAFSQGAKVDPKSDPVAQMEQSIGLRKKPGLFSKVYGVDLSTVVKDPEFPKSYAEGLEKAEKVMKSDTYGNVKGMIDLSMYGKSFKDSAYKFLVQMDTDNMLNMHNLNALADRMSKIYNMSVDDVKKYFAYALLQIHPMQISTH